MTRRSSTSSRKVLPLSFDTHHQHDNNSNGRFSYDGNEWNRKNNSDTASSVFNLSASKCCKISIRNCLVIVISSLIMVSVVMISGIWMFSFAYSQYSLTTLVRDRELMKMIEVATEILKNIVYISGTVTDQLIGDDFKVNNYELGEKRVYSAYKSIRKYMNGTVISSYVGDCNNNVYGVIKWENRTTLVNTTRTSQMFYTCKDPENSKFCDRSSIPDSLSSPFDFSYLTELCRTNPNKQFFSQSYSDITMPDLTFITNINCVYESNDPSVSFDFFYAVDITIETISEILQSQLKSISGSKSFIVETNTNYIIAVDDSNVVYSTWDERGNNIRKTPFDISDKKIVEIANEVKAAWKNWKDLECNSLYVVHSNPATFALSYRLCTETLIDWTFVLMTPRLNYVAPTVIATMVAIIGSFIIVAIGVGISFVVSLRIVEPFNNLISLFESVSNMDLDQLILEPSIFSEIRKLQQTFSLMVYNIRLYKSFIPANLLLELESGEQETATRLSMESYSSPRIMTPDSIELEKKEIQTTTAEDNSLEDGSGKSTSKLSKILDIRKNTLRLKSKFSLYLEPRKISINQMYIEGLNEWLLSLDGNPIHVVSLLGDLFAQVDSVIRTSSGHLVKFENDLLTIAYNTTITQNNHEEKAITSAKLLQENLMKVKVNKWKDSGVIRSEIYDMINFRFAICTQKTFCGNIGTNEIKHFAIFSSTRHNLDQLVKFAKKLKISIIITHHIKQYCYTKFETRFLDRRELQEDYYFSSLDDNIQGEWEIGSYTSNFGVFTKECIFYELGDSIKTENGK